MITFIARFLKGLILGWIMSLMMYLVKRALSKAMGANMPPSGQRRAEQPSQNPYARPTANQNHHDVVETIWVGMSAEQLRRSFGWPARKEMIADGEIWTYANLNGQGTQTHVTVQKDAVVGWQDQRTEQSNSAI